MHLKDHNLPVVEVDDATAEFTGYIQQYSDLTLRHCGGQIRVMGASPQAMLCRMAHRWFSPGQAWKASSKHDLALNLLLLGLQWEQTHMVFVLYHCLESDEVTECLVNRSYQNRMVRAAKTLCPL